ncbi:MAG: site-specific integrase [Candidatus Magnetomorum sp.]|nr:site-specific integrase [Candidatus Magnetomorum sp.]
MTYNLIEKKGVWYLEITANGKTVLKKVGDKQTGLAVIRKLKDKQPFIMNSFQDEAKQWLEKYVSKRLRIWTKERYQHALENKILPVFGSKSIGAIKRSDIKSFLMEQLDKGQSKSSIELYRTVMSSVFNYAIDDEIITHNPTINILKSLNLEKDEKNEVCPYTYDETRKFLDICEKKYPATYPLFITAFQSGLRLGELLALEWNDIDLDNRKIKVSKSYKRGVTSGTKTGKTRYVDISDKLFNVLHAERKTSQSNYLFINSKGKRHEQNTIHKHFKRIIKNAGLRDIRFHDIRHTFISLLISNGAQIVYVKEQAGHTSIKMTIDTYSKWIPKDNALEINKLNL